MHEITRNLQRHLSYFCSIFILLVMSLAATAPLTAQDSQTPPSATETGETNTDERDQTAQTLTIFAASSLTDVMQALGDAFVEQAAAAGTDQTAATEIEIVYNFAGSSTLAAQLRQGAPADVFASANPDRMQHVVADDLIDPDSVQTFALNELALIVPEANPGAIDSAANLSRLGILLVLATPGVPVREYTDDLLRELDRLYGAQFSGRVMRNLVSEEDNVRRVVAKIALGEADVGIAYRTDVTEDVSDDIRIIPLPPNVGPTAEYPIAPLREAANPELAQAFTEFVLSDVGQDILAAAGFGLPERDDQTEADTETGATNDGDD
jgi:molybdate transport system substrate-binding protein